MTELQAKERVREIARILADAVIRIEAKRGDEEKKRVNTMLPEQNSLDFREKESVHGTIQRQYTKEKVQ